MTETAVPYEETAVSYETIDDTAIHIWLTHQAPGALRREGWAFVIYVPAGLVSLFPRPLFERDGAEICEEGDGALVAYTEMPFPIAVLPAG